MQEYPLGSLRHQPSFLLLFQRQNYINQLMALVKQSQGLPFYLQQAQLLQIKQTQKYLISFRLLLVYLQQRVELVYQLSYLLAWMQELKRDFQKYQQQSMEFRLDLIFYPLVQKLQWFIPYQCPRLLQPIQHFFPLVFWYQQAMLLLYQSFVLLSQGLWDLQLVQISYLLVQRLKVLPVWVMLCLPLALILLVWTEEQMLVKNFGQGSQTYLPFYHHLSKVQQLWTFQKWLMELKQKIFQ